MSGKTAFTAFQPAITLVFTGLAIALAAAPPGAGGNATTGHQARHPGRIAPGRPDAAVSFATLQRDSRSAARGAVRAAARAAARTVARTAAPAGASSGAWRPTAMLDSYSPAGGPRRFALYLLVHQFHWGRWQFTYLDRLWERESGWNPFACNPYSGAYGIPQALPGSKMSSAGPDWRTNARTQIRWGMSYILGRYGTPYAAWLHEAGYGWY